MLKKSSACDPIKLPVDTNGVVLDFETGEGGNVAFKPVEGTGGVTPPTGEGGVSISWDYP